MTEPLITFEPVKGSLGQDGLRLQCSALPECLKCTIWPDADRGFNRRTVVNGIGKYNWHSNLNDAKTAARGWAMRHLKQIATPEDIAAYRATKGNL